MSELAHDQLRDAVLRPVGAHAFEACVEQLGNALRLGIYPVGSALPTERELADRLEVSRATLREALAALRAAGLLDSRRGRGGGTVVVSSTATRGMPTESADDDQRRAWLDALTFRRVVEGGAAHLAASRELSDAERLMLTSCHDEVSCAADDDAHRQANSRFHLTLATLSGSSKLAESVAEVQAVVHQMLSSIPVLAVNISHSDHQHAAIVDAVLAHDPQTAQQVMWEHCDDTAALLRGLLT